MRVAKIQHASYHNALWIILNAARHRFVSAERIVQTRTELGRRFDLAVFDHRTLQRFHDALAARFRFRYCMESSLFDPKPDKSDESELINDLWIAFLREELSRLLNTFEELAANIGIAASYPNPEAKGTAAEEYLHELTVAEYPMLKL